LRVNALFGALTARVPVIKKALALHRLGVQLRGSSELSPRL
jgi:hypothetical protein